MTEQEPVPHGHQGRIYQPAPAADGQAPRQQGVTMGTWGEQLVVFAQTPEAVRQILDRLEGRGPQEPPVLSGGMAVGDMYGGQELAWCQGEGDGGQF